ncbi:MAG: polyprenyl diphosphate synthase [Minisyncoccota bacterium]
MKMNKTSDVACIGIIMDGSRRWARARNRPVFEGHAEGYKKLKEVLHWTREANIPHVVAYAFSTENWHRSEKEVGYLVALFRSILENEMQEMLLERVRVRFVGDRARFGEDVQKMMGEMEAATAKVYDSTLHLLMSYGGRAEIVAATNALLREGAASVTEEAFAERLWSHPMPDPDLIIRTGAEQRLSNFLPWQSAYSELFFVDAFWPDFSREAFDSILVEFASRNRRHGR